MEGESFNMKELDPKEYGMEEVKAQQIAQQFTPMLERMAELEKEANQVFALDPAMPQAAIEARALRLQYKKVRTGTAIIHKEQKAFYLAAGRYVDGWKNTQAFASQGIEERLLEIEKHAENLEKERILKLAKERTIECLKYTRSPMSLNALGEMGEDIWSVYILGLKAEAERLEEERLEQARLEEIEREKETLERERIRIEKERAKAETLRQAQAQAERERLALKNAEREKALRLKAEKEKALKEKERARLEKERAKLAKEKEKTRLLQAELKAKKEKELAEQKRIREVELAERKAARALSLLDEKEKVNLWVDNFFIDSLSTDTFSPEGKAIVERVNEKFVAFQEWAARQVDLIK